MEPRVTKRDRKLHLSYELPHRIHSAQIYPITAPNGSTVIIYGYESGIRILWRGGRRPKAATKPAPKPQPPSRPNGASRGNEVIILDDSDDEVPAPEPQASHQDQEYEDDEDELDPDCPYPTLIQTESVDLGTEVLHLAIPSVPTSPSSRIASVLQSHAVVAVACADGRQRVLRFPLAPPSEENKHIFTRTVIRKQVAFAPNASLCRALAVKIVMADSIGQENGSQATVPIVVAAVSDTLELRRLLVSNELTAVDQDVQPQSIRLPHLATEVSFHPGNSSTQLSITDVSGAARIYDPYASVSSSRRPASADSSLNIAADDIPLGKWIMTFQTSFLSGKTGAARRKRILGAKWVLGGKALLAVLEDGEWGTWDASASSQSGQSVGIFVSSGFLGTSAVSESAEPVKQRRGLSKLAPMTPNTRKAKAEVLFSGAPKMSGGVAKGGISVSSSTSRAGQTDESVLLWYNGDIYSIPSFQAFWQRSTAGSGGIGSLYTAGLTHVNDINLMNEAITSVSQFTPSTAGTSFGQMNVQRDLLVATEHRLIILQAVRPLTPPKGLFQQALAERPAPQDQRMLDAGELGVDGLDRILDGMANGNAKPRRVGFAQ